MWDLEVCIWGGGVCRQVYEISNKQGFEISRLVCVRSRLMYEVWIGWCDSFCGRVSVREI